MPKGGARPGAGRKPLHREALARFTLALRPETKAALDAEADRRKLTLDRTIASLIEESHTPRA